MEVELLSKMEVEHNITEYNIHPFAKEINMYMENHKSIFYLLELKRTKLFNLMYTEYERLKSIKQKRVEIMS